ncbi:hypothetical protein X975_02919, partial [Stegodyphus mimosarum]
MHLQDKMLSHSTVVTFRALYFERLLRLICHQAILDRLWRTCRHNNIHTGFFLPPDAILSPTEKRTIILFCSRDVRGYTAKPFCHKR